MPEIRGVSNFNVKPGAGDEYKQAWNPDYDVVNGQPGCVQYELFQSTRNPENFALVQHWESRGGYYSYWEMHRPLPVAGGQFLDDPAARKVGRSSVEFYWRQKYYRWDGHAWLPVDGQADPDDKEGSPFGVRLVINMAAKEGMTDAYAEAWSPHYDEVNAEPGCLQYELFRSTRNPQNLCLLEHWRDRAAFLTHWALELTRESKTRPFSATPEERKVGRGGLEIYYHQQYYVYDGSLWVPNES